MTATCSGCTTTQLRSEWLTFSWIHRILLITFVYVKLHDRIVWNDYRGNYGGLWGQLALRSLDHSCEVVKETADPWRIFSLVSFVFSAGIWVVIKEQYILFIECFVLMTEQVTHAIPYNQRLFKNCAEEYPKSQFEPAFLKKHGRAFKWKHLWPKFETQESPCPDQLTGLSTQRVGGWCETAWKCSIIQTEHVH